MAGDNNYPDGVASTIDPNIGQYYHEFISPYPGIYGVGDTINRFFPTLGNHDVRTDDGQPYTDYFTLPNYERYYDFVWGDVHFFALNSNSSEPDGADSTSIVILVILLAFFTNLPRILSLLLAIPTSFTSLN